MKWLNSECRSNWVRYNQIQLLPSVHAPSTSNESPRNGSPPTNALRFVNNYRTIFWFTDVYTFFLLFQWLYWGFTDAISFWNQSWKCFQSSLYRCRIQWNGHIPTNSQYLHLIDYVFNSNQVLFICTEARNSRTRHNRKFLFEYCLTRAFCLLGFFSFWCGPQTKDELFRFWITNGLSVYFYSLLWKTIICICFH